MKKFLLFIIACLVCISGANGVGRGTNTATRTKGAPITTPQNKSRSITSRNAIKTVVQPRATKSVSVLTPKAATRTQSVSNRTSATQRSTTQDKKLATRATTATNTTPTQTRTGAAYEQCKAAFFTCMDQFCLLKDDNFRRCSCNDRVFDFQETYQTYQSASEKLSEFSENLDVVALTREQALAMKTASEGEDALTEDKSASKQLLQAIMNSIRGEDSSVGGKYKDLNSISMPTDISNSFGMDDSGQIIATYNGTTLYKAVYPKCRDAVREDCNDASLQRAVNAYLMTIEQDCNTVEAALKKQQKNLKDSTHENSALLDLARVENRRSHNSDDVATCLVNVENAVLNEEVCGAGYHRCLDYGQFIDVTTGAPLTGITDFYKLSELLTFKSGASITEQKLSSIQNNQKFVQFFENKTKKFAMDALNKCSEDADYVWQQYLDRALLDIYYAQKSKVETIQQSCLDLVASCYDNQNISIKNAMANLTGDSTILMKPATVSLTTEMCSKYIDSCNGMFDGNIIQTYIAKKDSSDLTSACRSVAQQCFDKFGGTGYNSFYYTQSGLFRPGRALDWFTLYDKDNNTIVSPCAKQVFETQGCEEKLDEVFGGFNRYGNDGEYVYSSENQNDTTQKIRPSGIATEVYYKILDNLRNNCNGLGGYFVEYRHAKQYGYKPGSFCNIDSTNSESIFYIDPVGATARSLTYWYHFLEEENMCPLNYSIDVDTQSWGICSCWENGGRRSKNGQIATCRPILPTIYAGDAENDIICTSDILCKKSYDGDSSVPRLCSGSRSLTYATTWCQQTTMSSAGQVCPMMFIKNPETNSQVLVCSDSDGDAGDEITAVSASVPSHKSNNQTTNQ